MSYTILWLAADEQACGTYRCYVPAYSLRDQGVTNHVLLHEQMPTSDPANEFEGVDIAVFQRVVQPLGWAWMQAARRMGVKIVVEMDDDLFDVPRHNPAAWLWTQKPVQRLLRRQLEFCDLVLVSTVPLAQTVQTKLRWPDRSKIRVCPNHVHPTMWGHKVWEKAPQFDNKGKTVIGWHGSQTHDRDFREVVPALKKILDTREDVMVRFFGDVPDSIKGEIPEARFEWVKGVQLARFPATLRYVHFDIGLAPITNSNFNQGKSCLKWIDYGALQIPCIASRVYPYAKAIRHGETGFLAASTTEWVQHLEVLLQYEGRRRQVGEAAYREIWERHSHHACARTWSRAFEELLDGQCTDSALRGAAGAGEPAADRAE